MGGVRVHEVSTFVRDLKRGTERARSGRPFSVWTLANSSPVPGRTGQQLVREWQGVDAVDIERTAKPDLICFEVNWPDWMNPALPGNYPLGYGSFTDPLRHHFPNVPFIFQADLGSSPGSRRSRQWIQQFEDASRQMGATGSTLYMHGIEKWIYTEAPQVRQTEKTPDGLLLIFQKRLEPSSAGTARNYRFTPAVKVLSAIADGNLVRLKLGGPRVGVRYLISIDNVRDDPRQWIFKGSPSNRCRQDLSVGPL